MTIAWWRGVPLRWGGGAPALELAGGLGLGLAAALACWRLRRLPVLRAMSGELARVLGPLSLPEILVVAASSGVGEELLFRGAVLGASHGYAPGSEYQLPGTQQCLRFVDSELSMVVRALQINQGEVV